MNIQNVNYNECFKWCLVRNLHPVDYHSGRIRKIDKDFAKELDFKDTKFSIKVRNTCKIKKKELYRHWCLWLSKKGEISNLYIKKYFQKACLFIIKDYERFFQIHL